MKHETHGSLALEPGKRYTYGDYRLWPEDERWELIGGVPYAMSPGPLRRHQRLVSLLITQLVNWFEGKPCMPLVSPLDVFLPEGAEERDDIDTVVQPDLVVVCDEAKLIDEGVMGGPDFVIEILSPSTAWRDQTEKRDLYERHGVREFWTINPETLDATIWLRQGEGFGVPCSGSLRVGLESTLFPGLVLKIRVRL
ncbi:MAG: hypothetical protein A2Z99_05710 [Treponema sp. GWB1_62_6]|nr:MAG: hypothetical protein A2001_19125 [Treponema sp. GWC1_61_84]OHE70852.1 MAG: hypothetical protein A2Z99_05710 [Treponema sp. GWB1_62_6]OHE74753.1 MAG: hypothetical protein A2413_03330 [Treponema sp. RIFOXYC1_FULL_61_9]